MSDQFFHPSEALLRERHFEALRSDLQRINQTAGITAKSTTLREEQPYCGSFILQISHSNQIIQEKVTHCLCVYTGHIEELIPTFSADWHSDGQIQQADGEVIGWNL